MLILVALLVAGTWWAWKARSALGVEPVLGWLLLALKVIALAAVAASLVRRASPQIDAPPEQPN